jgi:hypothetical protein
MTLVSTILSGAYLRSTSFDPGKLALDDELIEHLNRVYQRVWPLLARARPDQFGASTTLAWSGTPAMCSLPASILDLLDTLDGDGATVNVIPVQDRQRRWVLAPAIYRQGMTLRSRGETGDPVAGDSLALSYLDQPAALTDLTDETDTRWPVRHDQLLVDFLAVYLATKDSGMKPDDRAGLLRELQQDVATLVNDFGIPPSAMGWVHADAERVTA